MTPPASPWWRSGSAACAALFTLGASFAADTTASGKSFAPLEDKDEQIELPANAFATVPERDPNRWSFTLEPYLWALGTSGDIGVKGF